MKTLYMPLFLMDEANDGGGQGGGGNTTTTNNTGNQQQNQQSDADKERERLLTENAELRKKQKDAETALSSVRDEIANLKKAGHKTAGDWQKVAEALEQEVTGLKSTSEKLKAAFENTIVTSRIREEALKQGVKPDMVDLLDSLPFAEVEFALDEENLKFNLKGVDTAVGNLKKLRPSLFGAAPPPQFNKGTPGAPGKPATLEDAKSKYLAAHKNRFKDPVAFKAAAEVYQNAIFEARKAKK